MHEPEKGRVGYVVKRYPCYSETFIVNEILAHEAAGLELIIYSLVPPNDSHFQDALAQVRAPVRYLMPEHTHSADFWTGLQEASHELPGLWKNLKKAKGAEFRTVHQAVMLARQVRRQNIGHLHAHFLSRAATVARLAACFANCTYSCTAHAKDIFHA